MVAEQKRIAKNEVIPSIQSYSMQPNTMQKSFVYNLRNLRKQGIDKALLISATGTGKTYASAFAMRELGFKRVLFLVHRNQIAKQAKKSFENVFGSRIYTRTTDIYQSPNEKANIANRSDASYFVSIHRNSSPQPKT